MASMRLTWRGQNVSDRVNAAAATGINQTMAACVTVAQNIAPRDTGFYASTIETVRPAQRQGGVTTGRWGNATADYAIWIEIGARGRPGQYVLRRGADAEYRNLAGRIRAAL